MAGTIGKTMAENFEKSEKGKKFAES